MNKLIANRIAMIVSSDPASHRQRTAMVVKIEVGRTHAVYLARVNYKQLWKIMLSPDKDLAR